MNKKQTEAAKESSQKNFEGSLSQTIWIGGSEPLHSPVTHRALVFVENTSSAVTESCPLIVPFLII